MNPDGTVDIDDPEDVCEHGESLGLSCDLCHANDDWELDEDFGYDGSDWDWV